MRRSLATTLVAVLTTFSSVAVAGPLEGELFGHKLGSKYPVTTKSRGGFSSVGHWIIVAERAEKPKDLASVELIATAKTYTIGNIYGKTEFAEEAPARALAAKYGDLLHTLYAGKCQPLQKFLEETLRLRCGEYELSVSYFKPLQPTDKHSVQVGLSYFRDENTKWKQIQELFRTEFDQFEKESKMYRLEKARTDRSLKGLQ